MNNNGSIIILIFIAICVVFFAFDFFMRKLLKVENKKWFSYNHINHLHKIVDWAIRITFTVLILASTFYRINIDSTEIIWYLDVWFILTIFIIISESVRAFMEWKYETNRKTYILTISEMALMIVVLISIVKTNFFNLLI
ncbi:DUF4181 domain-containing protein [Rummeliibacillus sp. NPDC094406]|uniref:DUF4181 domain-containing protein n=1 Tax=Rummeliibacillus sp. NPDC094406 TaxID=3364511 RepID=UPI003803C371